VAFWAYDVVPFVALAEFNFVDPFGHNFLSRVKKACATLRELELLTWRTL
jgi:hypothetical protein